MDWNLLVNTLMVIFTATMAGLAYFTIHQNRKDKQDVNRANIVPYFETTRDLDIYFVVKNFGLSEARNILISSDETFINSRDETFESFFDTEIKSMPLNFTIKIEFDNGQSYYREFKDNFPVYNVTVNFDDIYGNSYSETYELNLAYIAQTTFIGIESDDIIYYLKDIGKKIRDSSLKSPLDDFGNYPSLQASLSGIDNSLKALLGKRDNNENLKNKDVDQDI